MKEQKKVFYFSAGVMAFSSILGIIFEFEIGRYFITLQMNYFRVHRDYVVNILIGLFGGSFLSFCTAWINYSSEKEKFIIEFFNLVEDFYTICDKVQYLYLRGDPALLAAYYQEKYTNKKMQGASEQCAARDKLLRSYKEKDPECNEYMCLAEDTDTVDKELDNVIKSYYAVSNFDFSKIERTLKKKDFMFPKSRKEMKIELVYGYISKLYADITDKVEYWRDFDAKDNLIIEICRFQPQIFDNVERHGSAFYLPPKNNAVNKIKEMLLPLNQQR